MKLVCSRLLAGRAGIHIDFHADRHFDDLRRFPGHLGLSFLGSNRDELRPANKVIRIKNFAPVKFYLPTGEKAFFVAAHNLFAALANRQTDDISRGSYGGRLSIARILPAFA
jgi:hypothetical protein